MVATATNKVLHDKRYYADTVCDPPRRLDGPVEVEAADDEPIVEDVTDMTDIPAARATNPALHDKRYYRKRVCEAPRRVANETRSRVWESVATIDDVEAIRVRLRDADTEMGKTLSLNLQWQRKPCGVLAAALGVEGDFVLTRNGKKLDPEDRKSVV